MRKKTPSFIAEFPLSTTPADERELSIRLDAARNIYNACMGESLRRLDLMRESKAWQAAQAMPKHTEKAKNNAELKADNKARADAFKAVEEKFAFNSCAIQKFGEQCRDGCWIGDHLGSHDTQTTTLRAFRAVEQYLFGKRGRPRFKRFECFESVEGKEQAVIRYKSEPVHAVLYSGLVLPLILDPKDKHDWQKDALGCRVKYTRILRREVRGKTRWYAQLIMEGVEPTKGRSVGEGVVGLDIGPSTIASFSLKEANLEPFCPTVTQPWKEARRIERAMDRSRRDTNPDNYEADGTVKKGPRKWNRSRRYILLARKHKELERRLAAERKRSHGELANRILEQGSTIKTEKLSYESFQKCFGKSVKVRAPGMLVSALERKAKVVGGSLVEISTRKTKLSQFDHTTAQYVKKPLSQREHIFGDRVTAPVQRDLYSAFLAFCCISNILDIRQVMETWSSAEPLLRQAMSRSHQSARGRTKGFPKGIDALGADRLSKKDIARCEAADVVAVSSDSTELAEVTARAVESVGDNLQNPLDLSMGRFSRARMQKMQSKWKANLPVDAPAPRAASGSFLGKGVMGKG